MISMSVAGWGVVLDVTGKDIAIVELMKTSIVEEGVEVVSEITGKGIGRLVQGKGIGGGDGVA